MSVNKYGLELRQFINGFRDHTIKFGCRLSSISGRKILNRNQTLDLLKENGKSLPYVNTTTWLTGDTRVTKYGLVCYNGCCLDVDYGAKAGLAGRLGEIKSVQHVAALWSHTWMGYYHWIIDIAPKILLFQNDPDFHNKHSVYCYPFSGSSYENEVINMLGLSQTSFINSKSLKYLTTDSVGFSMLPGWYKINPAALLLRERLIGTVPPGSHKRIYIARAGRRRCVNEDNVMKYLSRHDFVFIEDIPRTVAEQISLFNGAEMVVAPHGAALTNLLWCNEGTSVIELFNPLYTPRYYHELSNLCGLKYFAIGIEKVQNQHWSNLNMDIDVDLSKLEALINSLI